MKTKAIFLFLLPILLNFSCNSIEPPVNGNGQDTTSHNFTWQTWTFGEHSTSVLYDVAIIDENNIWAVGEIYLNDSLGQPDTEPYAVARWDGTIWALMKVSYHDFNQTVKHPGPLFTVAVIEGEIYAVSYANLLKWTGSDWEEKAFFMEQIPFDGQVLKMWGIDKNNIYCVGRNGAIYYYFGTSWQKIESGTDVDIHDIWGNVDNRTGESTILAVASFQNYGRALDLLKIDGTIATKLDTTGLHVNQHSIWLADNNKVYVVGNGVYYKDNIMTIGWQLDDTHPLIYKERIRGTGSNDIFIVGDFGLVSHFNGAIWKHYTGNELPNLLGNYYSVVLKNNSMVAVGQMNDGQAIILRGDR